MTLTADWSYPTAIRFGPGRIAEIADCCAATGMKRPLLVTDRGLAQLPMTANVLGLLDAAGLGAALFSEVDANPTDTNLTAGVAAFKAGNHDGVVAFGGGSSLDLGKLIAFHAGQTRPIADFEGLEDQWMRADADAIHPIVAIPTTAGTGSEVGKSAVIINTTTEAKKIVWHPKMLAAIVIADAELTVGMPRVITVGTGLDAFAHCLEAYCTHYHHPMSQGIALEGMRLVKENLQKVCADPNDMDARGQMMSAAAMGATAFQKGLGAIHALSHPIGALYNTHHGMTNAVVMPAVLAFNRPAIEDRITAAARYMDIEGGFDGFFDFVLRIRADLGVPDKLGGLGVTDDRLDDLVSMAVEDPCALSNPVEMTLENTRALFEACL